MNVEFNRILSQIIVTKVDVHLKLLGPTDLNQGIFTC